MNYIRRYWGYLGMSIVLAAVTVALTLYLPVLTGRAVDLIIEKEWWILQGSLQS